MNEGRGQAPLRSVQCDRHRRSARGTRTHREAAPHHRPPGQALALTPAGRRLLRKVEGILSAAPGVSDLGASDQAALLGLLGPIKS